MELDYEIRSFWSDFEAYATDAANGTISMLFRGEPEKYDKKQENNKLIPSLGRKTYTDTCGDITILEEKLLSEFKRLSFPVIEKDPDSEFEWLFLAQHYGLPTRLLDWSTNPLVALFFAVEKEDQSDAVLYVIKHPITDHYECFDCRTADIKSEYNNTACRAVKLQPNQGEFVFVRPKYTDIRYINQKSVFSCHADPFKELKCSGLEQLKISKEWKHAIRERLRVLGITNSYIYPGLGGVASEVKSVYFDPVINGKVQYAPTIYPK